MNEAYPGTEPVDADDVIRNEHHITQLRHAVDELAERLEAVERKVARIPDPEVERQRQAEKRERQEAAKRRETAILDTIMAFTEERGLLKDRKAIADLCAILDERFPLSPPKHTWDYGKIRDHARRGRIRI